MDPTAQHVGGKSVLSQVLLAGRAWTSIRRGGHPMPISSSTGRPSAGVGKMNEAMVAKNQRASWNSYLQVDDAQATCEQVVRLGGAVTVRHAGLRFRCVGGSSGMRRRPIGLWQQGNALWRRRDTGLSLLLLERAVDAGRRIGAPSTLNCLVGRSQTLSRRRPVLRRSAGEKRAVGCCRWTRNGVTCLPAG